MKSDILNSIIELKEKNTNKIIPIESKKIIDNDVYINDIKITKKTIYIITYKCKNCQTTNSVGTTQILRKIRRNIDNCPFCLDNNSILKLNFQDIKNKSIDVFSNLCNIYRDNYFLSNLSSSDFYRIVKNIESFGNGKYCDIDNYEFWPIYQVHNKLQFEAIIYDKVNNIIFKPHQPIIKCDNCKENWKISSLKLIKNKVNIICDKCQINNRIIKLKTCKNINNDILIFESKLEKKFINWANTNNILLINGPKINNYKINFQINNIFIIILTPKYRFDKPKQSESLSNELSMEKCIFLTYHNYNQMIKELENIIK
jgi:hypothetical protein